MTAATLLTGLEDGILTITINRPDKLNALNRQVFDELNDQLDLIYSDPAIRGVIITGSGNRAFVAGADIAEFLQTGPGDAAALAQRGQDIFLRIEHCPKPIVAAVNGFALGGGCELAMSCHFRTASDNAKFGQPEVSLGLIPGYGGTQRLTRLVGIGRSMELNMSGRIVDAGEAKAIGLVNHVVPAEGLLEETRKILSVILSKSPLAVAAVIAAVNAAMDPAVDGFAEEIRLFSQCFGTHDMKEGVQAFLEKRKPVFPGK